MRVPGSARRGASAAKARSLGILAGALVAAACGAPPVSAQSLLERPPDLDVSWVAQPGTIQFDFLHRFTTSGAPERKVINSPTFLLGAGLPAHLMVGFNYATNSTIAPAYPNEWEYFGRWKPVSEDLGAPLDAAIQGGYNQAAKSFDAALGFARVFGPIRLALEPRFFSHPYDSAGARAALAGGGVLKLNRWLALAGDVARLLGPGEARTAWGAGIQLAIPYTPHTLSIQATNTTTGTLEGASLGTSTRRYGFAFTIPFTLARYFGHVAAAPPPAPPSTMAGTGATGAAGATPATDTAAAATPAAGADSGAAPATATATAAAPAAAAGGAPAATPRAAARRARPRSAGTRVVIHNLVFNPGAASVAAGGLVTWTNNDTVVHSVTADNGSFDSGLIQPGASWSHTFAKPGHVAYHCTPHPFMHGSVVVK